MKKQLLTGIVAALFAVPAVFADVSISGNGYFMLGFKDQGGDAADTTARNNRIRLMVDGDAGNTSVHARFRNNSTTRVSNASAGNGSNNISSALMTDYLYFKTKVGAINIKAGDWWGGAPFMGSTNDNDAIELSTDLAGWNFTVGSVQNPAAAEVRDSQYYKLSGNLSGLNVALTHRNNFLTTESLVTRTLTGLGTYSSEDEDSNSYNALSVSGDFGGTSVSAEWFDSSYEDGSAHSLHFAKSVNGINLQAFYASIGYGAAQVTDFNDYTPYGEGAMNDYGVAYYNLTSGGPGYTSLNPEKDTVFAGIAAGMKYAGMDINVALGKLDINQNDNEVETFAGGETACDNTAICGETSFFKDIAVTYPLSKSSQLVTVYGTWAGDQVMSTKINVSF